MAESGEGEQGELGPETYRDQSDIFWSKLFITNDIFGLRKNRRRLS